MAKITYPNKMGWKPQPSDSITKEHPFKILDFNEFQALVLEMHTLVEEVNQIRCENQELSRRIKVYEDRDEARHKAEIEKNRMLMEQHKYEYEQRRKMAEIRKQDHEEGERYKKLLERAMHYTKPWIEKDNK